MDDAKFNAQANGKSVADIFVPSLSLIPYINLLNCEFNSININNCTLKSILSLDKSEISICTEVIMFVYYDISQSCLYFKGVENAEFICGKAEDLMPSLMRQIEGQEVVAVVDPPRAGLREFLCIDWHSFRDWLCKIIIN